MIIIINAADQNVLNNLEVLKKQYPNETVFTLDEFLSISPDKFKELNGSFPARITFIDHSGWDRRYGGYTPEELARHIKAWLQKIAITLPQIKKLNAIDLIGCHVGFVKNHDDNNAFAYVFAKNINELESDGFVEINVRAVTNLSIAKPFSIYTLRVQNGIDNEFEVYAYTDKEQFNQADKYLLQLNQAIEEKNLLIDRLNDLEKIKEEMIKEHQKIKAPLACFEEKIESLKDEAKIIKEKESRLNQEQNNANNKISDNAKKITANGEEFAKIRLRKMAMENEYKELKKLKANLVQQYNELVKSEADLSREIYLISKDKKYLSTDDEIRIREIQTAKRILQNKRHVLTATMDDTVSEQLEALMFEKNAILNREKELQTINEQLMEINAEQNLLVTNIADELLKIKEIKLSLDKEYQRIDSESAKLNENLLNLVQEAKKVAKAINETSEALDIKKQEVIELRTKMNSSPACIFKTKDIRATLDAHPECNFTHQVKKRAKLQIYSAKLSFFANDAMSNSNLVNDRVFNAEVAPTRIVLTPVSF